MDGDEGGADCGAAAVSMGSDIIELCAADDGKDAGMRKLTRQRDFYLQTSSYACALQGEPIRGLTHFAGHQIVTGELPFDGDIRVR